MILSSRNCFRQVFCILRFSRRMLCKPAVSYYCYRRGKNDFQNFTLTDEGGTFERIRHSVKNDVKLCLVEDAKNRFQKTCANILENSREIDPIHLIFFPKIFLDDQNISLFADVYLNNWWTKLAPHLEEIHADLLTDLLEFFMKFQNADSSFLTKFKTNNFLSLCNEILSQNIETSSSKRVELLLNLLVEQSNCSERIPTSWFKENLEPFLNEWFLSRSPDRLLGKVLHISTKLYAFSPISSTTLEHLRHLAIDQMNSANSNSHGFEKLKKLSNLLGIGEYFLKAGFDPGDNFWSRWYNSLYLISLETTENRLLNKMYFLWFEIATKFQRENDLVNYFEIWSTAVFDIPYDKVNSLIEFSKFRKMDSVSTNYEKLINVLVARFSATNEIRKVDIACDRVFGSIKQFQKRENLSKLDLDIFRVLTKVNANSDGLVLQNIGWVKVERLVVAALKNVDCLSAKKFYNVLQLLESYAKSSMYGIPAAWIRKFLHPIFSSWIRRQKTRTSGSNVERYIGGICNSLAKFGVKPSEDELKIIVEILTKCFSSSNSDSKSHDSKFLQRFFNLLNSGEAFLHWNYDPQLFSNNFWAKWYDDMIFLEKKFGSVFEINAARNSLNSVFLSLVLQFDSCSTKFGDGYVRYVKDNGNRITPETALFILKLADEKCGKNSELLNFYLPDDVQRLLIKRTRPLFIEASFYWLVFWAFLFKACFGFYCINELRHLQSYQKF